MTAAPLTDEELAEAELGISAGSMIGMGSQEIIMRLVAEVRRLRAWNADLQATCEMQHKSIGKFIKACEAAGGIVGLPRAQGDS
jgi:hypothetical protein